jgi:hypothetical protein
MTQPTSQDAKHRIHPQLLQLAVPVGELTPDPRNARLHGERNLEEVARSYAQHGQRKAIVVQRVADDGTPMVVRAGNGQLEAAKRLGWTHIAALVVDERDHEAIAFAIRDNRTAELAEWDWRVVAETMVQHETTAGAGTFAELGFSATETAPLRQTTWFMEATGNLEDHTRKKPDKTRDGAELEVTMSKEDAEAFAAAMEMMRARFADAGMTPGHVVGRLAAHYLATVGHSRGVTPGTD